MVDRVGQRRYWGSRFWAQDGCVGTVGLNEEMMRKHVRWQEKREEFRFSKQSQPGDDATKPRPADGILYLIAFAVVTYRRLQSTAAVVFSR